MDINIGLSNSVRQQIAQNLGLLLADTYVLDTKVQNFYWNASDSHFSLIYLLLKKEHESLQKGIDQIGERIRSLGERAPGTLKQFLDMTSLQESSSDLSCDEMISNLLNDHEIICRFLRERMILASQLGDEGTAQLLIRRLCAHEKSAWRLRSHIAPI